MVEFPIKHFRFQISDFRLKIAFRLTSEIINLKSEMVLLQFHPLDAVHRTAQKQRHHALEFFNRVCGEQPERRLAVVRRLARSQLNQRGHHLRRAVGRIDKFYALRHHPAQQGRSSG